MAAELQVLVTVDTEPDNLWAHRCGAGMTNILALGGVHDFLAGLSLRPTYLVAHEVAVHDKAGEVIRQLAADPGCEVGAHVHAWLTPPAYPALDAGPGSAFLHEYPEEVRAAKLEDATAALAALTGRRPTSHRGGRWSIDSHTLGVLQGLGYLADTTVTPFVSWAGTTGASAAGDSHVFAPTQPYHPSESSPFRPGTMAILEIPVSCRPARPVPAGPYRRLVALLDGPRRGPRRWAGAALRRLAPVVTPNPASTPADALCRLAATVARESPAVLNLAIHSSEFTAGGAPWVQSREDEERVRRSFRVLVACLEGHVPWRGVTLSELAKSEAQRQPLTR
jgi:peptidoglycan/xylan/chitin deacetylase (PgdA/CDA1 family)